MPVDHVILNVRDYARSKAFYEQALKPLDYELIMEFGPGGGFGVGGKPDFWVTQRGEPTVAHVAFAAGDHAAVDAFYKAAIAAGGEDNGQPGPGRTTTRTITRGSSTIPTATTSRPSATCRNEPRRSVLLDRHDAGDRLPGSAR